MSNENWLQQIPWPTKQLPRDVLEARIEQLLATHWMAVLCTIGNGYGPRQIWHRDSAQTARPVTNAHE